MPRHLPAARRELTPQYEVAPRCHFPIVLRQETHMISLQL